MRYKTASPLTERKTIVLSFTEKDNLVREFNTTLLPNHHPISETLKRLMADPSRDYVTIRFMLRCMTFNEAVLFYDGFYYDERKYFMARKDMWTFANVNLTGEDDKEIDKFVKTRDNDILGVLIELLAAGYKTSFAWVDKQNSFVVTVSGTDRSSSNKGTSMTAWSDDLPDAIMVLGYKVFIKTNGEEWLDYEQTGGRR